jgi:DNA-binding transcriptional LysR family regulator
MRPRILSALDRAQLPHRIAYVSSHTAGVVSAVESGFCITALEESTVPTTLRRLGKEAKLPDLPTAEIALLMPLRPSTAAARLADAFREVFLLRQVQAA